MADIVKRLRDWNRYGWNQSVTAMEEAADYIEKLEAERDTYRSALNVCLYGWAACGDEWDYKGYGQSEYIQAILDPEHYPERDVGLENDK
ncbi:hypothetical protein OAF54_00705 [bacterium]|nr:hypothetical protein [bacterium]